MSACATELAAWHLAVLGDLGDQLCAVMAYDGYGHPYLHPVPAAISATRLSGWVAEHGPGQLRLDLDAVGPAATSSGRTWRTWVLPSVPTALRSLPPDRLAAAFADLLAGEVAA